MMHDEVPTWCGIVQWKELVNLIYISGKFHAVFSPVLCFSLVGLFLFFLIFPFHPCL
jgi:hypothetical protein